MRLVIAIALGIIGLASCGKSSETSENEFFDYFYAYDTIPKVYVYRNISNGLEEEFHRVFAINDSEGKHVVVEIYSEDGRILEALNYNIDSLDIADHMVVNLEQENTKAVLSENQLIPMSKKDKGVFATNFPGVMDSTFFLKYIERSFVKEGKADVLGKSVPTVEFKDDIILKLYNPWKKLEDVREGKATQIFAKGYGLVEWSSENKEVQYRLEKIISQSDFVKLMARNK